MAPEKVKRPSVWRMLGAPQNPCSSTTGLLNEAHFLVFAFRRHHMTDLWPKECEKRCMPLPVITSPGPSWRLERRRGCDPGLNLTVPQAGSLSPCVAPGESPSTKPDPSFPAEWLLQSLSHRLFVSVPLSFPEPFANEQQQQKIIQNHLLGRF